MRHALWLMSRLSRTRYASIALDKTCLDYVGQDMSRLCWTRHASIVLDKTCLDWILTFQYSEYMEFHQGVNSFTQESVWSIESLSLN